MLDIRFRAISVKRTFNDNYVVNCPGLMVKKPWKTHTWTCIPNDNGEYVSFDDGLWITNNIYLDEQDLDIIYKKCIEEKATIQLLIEDSYTAYILK